MNRLPFLLLALGCMFAIASCGPGNSTNTPGNPGNAAIAEPDKGDDKAGGDTAKETDDADDPPPAESELVTTRKAMVEEAWGYLKGEYNCAPTEDDPYALKSGWGPESTNVPYTALALQGLVGAHVWDADNAMIKDSVDWLLSVQEPTGAWSYPCVQSNLG